MFTFGFYDSLNGDRRYNAEQMSSIFDGIIVDGVFANVGEKFIVIPGSGLQVIVKTGRAWFKHTWSLNDAWQPIDIEEPDVYRPRIDMVVLEVNRNVDVRENSLKVVKGTPSTNPSKPVPIHEDDIDQYPLAFVTVKANATGISEADIENVVGQTATPFVTAPLEKVDITDLFNQFEGEFNEWFENLQEQLTDNVVANLQKQIDERVKIADVATLADIQAGTAGKWIDASIAKDQLMGITAGMKVGDIVFSLRDLEKETDGRLVACDQRILSIKDLDPVIQKLLDDRLVFPKNFKVTLDLTDSAPITGRTSYTQWAYYMGSGNQIIDKDGIKYLVANSLNTSGTGLGHNYAIALTESPVIEYWDYLYNFVEEIVMNATKVKEVKQTRTYCYGDKMLVRYNYTYSNSSRVFYIYCNQKTQEILSARDNYSISGTILLALDTKWVAITVGAIGSGKDGSSYKYGTLTGDDITISTVSGGLYNENGYNSFSEALFGVTDSGSPYIVECVVPFYNSIQVNSEREHFFAKPFVSVSDSRQYAIGVYHITEEGNAVVVNRACPLLTGLDDVSAWYFGIVDDTFYLFGNASKNAEPRLYRYTSDEGWKNILKFNDDRYETFYFYSYSIMNRRWFRDDEAHMHIIVIVSSKSITNVYGNETTNNSNLMDIDLNTGEAHIALYADYITDGALRISDAFGAIYNGDIQNTGLINNQRFTIYPADPYTGSLPNHVQIVDRYSKEKGILHTYANPVPIFYKNKIFYTAIDYYGSFSNSLVPRSDIIEDDKYWWMISDGRIGSETHKFLIRWDKYERYLPYIKNGYIKVKD